MKDKILMDLKPSDKFSMPVDDKERVLVKYTKHRITTRKREGKCEISKLDGNLKVVEKE